MEAREMTRTWPEDWESRKQGASCFFCTDLSDRSFYSGRTSEALLERWAIATGHAAVVFRGRHVADLGDLTPEELAHYWRDVQHVGRAISRAFAPCHVNYLLLGNLAPHLHVHVVPRYLDDSAPGMPLPWAPSPVPENVFDRQFSQLRDVSRELNR
jgi:diadenosine tetraphosphate (Ap4A) HIT family hydrolase